MLTKTLYKNDRYNRFCTGTLLFNPTNIGNISINKLGTSSHVPFVEVPTDTLTCNPASGTTQEILGMQYDLSINNITYPNSGIMSFGGQFVGLYYPADYYGNPAIFLPFGSFDNPADISNMISVVGYARLYSGTSFYLIDKNSCSNYVWGVDSFGDEYHSMSNVKIMDIEIIQNKSLYGNKNEVYKTYNTYNVTFRLPYDTDQKILNSLLESDGVVFIPDNRDIYDYQSGTQIYRKPLGGGSINPIGRDVSLSTDSLKISSVKGSKLGYDIVGTLNG